MQPFKIPEAFDPASVSPKDWFLNARLAPRAAALQRVVCAAPFPSSAIGVCLQGDTTLRLEVTLDLWRKGRIRSVIVSGGVPEDAARDEYPAPAMRAWLLDRGVPESAIHVEDRSLTTFDHPQHVNTIAATLGCSDVVVITSRDHLLRSYLRFLFEVLHGDARYRLYACCAGTALSWLGTTRRTGRTRLREFFATELTKLRTYRRLATFAEAARYARTLSRR